MSIHVMIDEEWSAIVHDAVSSGRYASIGEVVSEGLRLVAEREAKLVSLRGTLSAAISRGGACTTGEVDCAVADALDMLEQRAIG